MKIKALLLKIIPIIMIVIVFFAIGQMIYMKINYPVIGPSIAITLSLIIRIISVFWGSILLILTLIYILLKKHNKS